MRGRAEEFTQFVDGRYAAMLRSAILLTGNRHTAEDLLQEALLRTYGAWHRLEVLGAAESYTRTTMVRLMLHDRRRRWTGEIPTEVLPEHGQAHHADLVGTVVTVRRALRALPADQRAVLVLRYFEDLSEAETARVLGCRPGTVKSRASRGLARLRELGLLAADEPPSAPGDSVQRTAGGGR